VHNGLRATPGESTPKVMTTGKTTATPKITFANCQLAKVIFGVAVVFPVL